MLRNGAPARTNGAHVDHSCSMYRNSRAHAASLPTAARTRTSPAKTCSRLAAAMTRTALAGSTSCMVTCCLPGAFSWPPRQKSKRRSTARSASALLASSNHLCKSLSLAQACRADAAKSGDQRCSSIKRGPVTCICCLTASTACMAVFHLHVYGAQWRHLSDMRVHPLHVTHTVCELAMLAGLSSRGANCRACSRWFRSRRWTMRASRACWPLKSWSSHWLCSTKRIRGGGAQPCVRKATSSPQLTSGKCQRSRQFAASWQVSFSQQHASHGTCNVLNCLI